MASKTTGDGLPDVVVTALASSNALATNAEDTLAAIAGGRERDPQTR